MSNTTVDLRASVHNADDDLMGRLEEVYGEVNNNIEIKTRRRVCSAIFEELLNALDEGQVKVLLKYEDERAELYDAIKKGIRAKIDYTAS